MKANKSLIIWCLKWVTSIAAAVYAGRFLMVLIRRVTAPDVPGLDVDWSVPHNPQFFITLILVTAVASVWVLRGWWKGISAFLFSLVLIERFYSWAASTAQIKFNTSVNEIPRAGLLGDTFIGATVFELFALSATASLLVYGIFSIGSKVQDAIHAHGVLASHAR